MSQAKDTSASEPLPLVDVSVVAEDPAEANRRIFTDKTFYLLALFSVVYAVFHLFSLNIYPLETWSFRLLHICGALILGFCLYAPNTFDGKIVARSEGITWSSWFSYILLIVAAYTLYQVGSMYQALDSGEVMRIPAETETWHFGIPLLIATCLATVLSWLHPRRKDIVTAPDLVLVVCSVSSITYLLMVFNSPLRMSTGTAFAPVGITYAAIAGIALILEITRRIAGMALVIITGIFLVYVFAGSYLPGFLSYPGLTVQRFFSQIYTDIGILGPTTAVSSTYIILFIIFAAFLQTSKVGEYFINFAFAIAGRKRGGPAKVAIFASGFMGMINGTSAGNVVSTGSLTIPLMKKVGYTKTTSGAIEAAASTGGQIMPPIMGAGAFIMAEVTGIPYTEIAVAAIIPALLYFISVYFMVDLEAARLGMKGMRRQDLPEFSHLLRKVYLFFPVIILIAALFMGYSVIRAGTLAIISATVVSWFSPDKMGPVAILKALKTGAEMSVQIIIVCACAGIIVGVISLTGVGARFSSLLLSIAEANQLIALFFAMLISIMLGMGMPTTAAYAVAASVVSPGLIQLGIPPLTAHFFIFYFAVVSAITPPVALASYAAAGLSGANPMATSIESFKIGLAAFIVPFMFFYSSALLMDGSVIQIGRSLITAIAGVYLLSAGVQAWFIGKSVRWYLRVLLVIAALLMISGDIFTDIAGIILVLFILLIQSKQ